MMLDYEKMGRKIKKIRRSRRITQEVLAELVDLSVTHISNIETGKRIASLEAVVKIAAVLNVTLDSLLCGSQANTEFITSDLQRLLSDCSPYEAMIILDTANTVKKSLRENHNLLSKTKG